MYNNLTTCFLLLTILLVFCPTGTFAFGAGDIPGFSYIEGRAFRHGDQSTLTCPPSALTQRFSLGDIENILAELVKQAGGHAASSGGLLGFAKAVIDHAQGGAKFDKNDIKRVYFGNWLRDYSQAMDIAGLSKLSADTLVLIVGILGFMTFGYASGEYEVTAERLGVYLPVEHIDNPKGYAEKEGDARSYHPKLRPPVDPRELDIDQNTGMKNYMATENQGWDTSTAHIRRTLQSAIEHGRRAGGNQNADLWEAYRLLGTGLHTLEDLLAHSNWIEIGLIKMGHRQVFAHVGDDVTVDSPNGRAPPLVTGSFGSADFLHSLLGEATDHISQASVTDLSQKMEDAKNNDTASQISTLKSIFSKVGGGGGDDKISQGEQLEAKSKAYNFNPDDVAPPDVQKQLWELLKWRDGVMRDVSSAIESIPGLSDLVEELTEALNAYVYTILAPYVAPILSQAISALGEGSKAVIDTNDQYEVFNDSRASDPTHSLLSKDHFGLILNEPAGKIAQVVVIHTVNLIVQAWSDNSNPDQVIDQVLEAFHHPYYATGQSQIQHQMFEELQKWFGSLGPDTEGQILDALTKDSVRNGKNKRIGSEGQQEVEPGYGRSSGGGGYSGGHQSQQTYQSSQRHDGGRQSQQTYQSSQRHDGGRQSQQNYQSSQRHDGGHQSQQTYQSSQRHDGGHQSQQTYQSSQRHDGGPQSQQTYQSSQRHHDGGRQEQQHYGGSGEHEGRYSGGGYGGGREEGSYGGGGSRYEPSREEDNSRHNQSYGRESRPQGGGRSDAYSSGGDGNNREERGGYQSSYGGGHREHGGQHDRRDRDDAFGAERPNPNEGRGSGYDREESGGYQPSYGGGHREHGGHQDRRDRDDAFGAERPNPNEGRGSGYDREDSGGYQPSYGGGHSEHGGHHDRRDRDDTFGAERLNLNDGQGSGYGYGERRNQYGEDNY